MPDLVLAVIASLFRALRRRRILAEYFAYYHSSRTHLSLAKDSPETRDVEPAAGGAVRAITMGGLHHRYTRKAA